jgi:hypothetical protein
MTARTAAPDKEQRARQRRSDGRGRVRQLVRWILRFLAVWLLFLVAFGVGGAFVAGVLPTDAYSDPGVLSPLGGFLVVTLVNALVVSALVLTSRWRGWKLALALGLAYYGAVTFLMQIETWYFLSPDPVGPELLSLLFLMGVPTAFVAVPLSVWVLGRGRGWDAADVEPRATPDLERGRRWIPKVAVLAVVYVVVYFVAGYYIAWQNPELRAFYGEPGEALPFLAHMSQSSILLALVPFQIVRGLLWILCALPIIRGSRVGLGWTALLVGLFFSLPQNVAHLLANPLMPDASVRLAHMVETAVSTFLFGVLVVLLLHRELGLRRWRKPSVGRTEPTA